MTDFGKFVVLILLALIIACASPYVLGIPGTWPKVFTIVLVFAGEIWLGFMFAYWMEKPSERSEG